MDRPATAGQCPNLAPGDAPVPGRFDHTRDCWTIVGAAIEPFLLLPSAHSLKVKYKRQAQPAGWELFSLD